MTEKYVVEVEVEQIDEIFENATHQQHYLMQLYYLAIPEDWSKIATLGGFPECNSETWRYISEKSIKWDKEDQKNLPYDQQYFAGGLWMNSGFSPNDELDDFVFATDKSIIRWKNDIA
jgi:hypothetical protein